MLLADSKVLGCLQDAYGPIPGPALSVFNSKVLLKLVTTHSAHLNTVQHTLYINVDAHTPINIGNGSISQGWLLDAITMSRGGVMCAEGETDNSGIGSNLEQTRALVASLQTAVHFIQVLSESLAVVTQLLASSTMTDVQESITLLIYCHKFQVKVGSCTHQYWLLRSHAIIGAVIVVMQDAFCPHCPISSQKGCRLTVKLSVCVVSGSVQ